ncbi:MAG: hypothetical protein A2Y40_02525 [Candidatus Margulisbacteria bacterium GWF2_35_9]|nr:MAG: hypothetical protein A2Y40_02525 [Candidatus Margulisbacteria bacterium GWF2_35_9]
MRYLLDTNICIYIINKKPKHVYDEFVKYEIGDLYISSITTSELYYGIEKSKNRIKNFHALNKFLSPFSIIPYDNDDAIMYGKVRASLEKKGNIIGALDLMIAAQALEKGFTVVTNNEKEFSRVNKLKVENWIKNIE